MYYILYAPIGLNEEVTSSWDVLCEGYSSIAEAFEDLAAEIEKDVACGNQYAYRVIEQEGW